MEAFLIIWLILINVIAFYMMGIDKSKARRNKRRISEAALFTAAIIGGGVGAFLGMQVFRHKTKHTKFVIGIPFIMVVQIVLMFWLWLR
ncbi:MAG: DUF1294 domain-containing protein [Ruminococcaceae bacterium]|nr:DUF1294 domain-containing protein [Oscillospiraceae bacterium]